MTYTLAEIEACLKVPAHGSDWAAANVKTPRNMRPRGLEEIVAAAKYIPMRVVGGDTYETSRNALCGCAAALAEIGQPEEMALDLLADQWPDRETPAQVLRSTTTRNAASFWAIAAENGYQFKGASKPGPTPNQANSSSSSQQNQQHQRRASTARNLSHSKKMKCLNRCVEIQASRERNSITRQSRLLKAAKDLGVHTFINRAEIAQLVLIAKDRQQGHQYQSLDAAARLAMDRPAVHYLIPNLIPDGDMSIIGGRPKVGKTRFAIALVASILNGTGFLAFGTPSYCCPVLLVTDDQADGDTADMLQDLRIWEHPKLHWSPHFRLTETDIDKLLADIKANPGALVVLDSLRSISRSLQYGENDPEMGSCLYDLKAAVIEAGGTLVAIHHCNKTDDLIGVEALSGHSAIAGAANTIITLHYCPNEKGRPDKQNTQRRLIREARSGKGCDLVISPTPGSGAFYQVGDFSAWQQQVEDAKKESKREAGTTTTQSKIMELLDKRMGAWLTCREVVTALNLNWDGGSCADAVRVRSALNRLAYGDEYPVQRVRAGTEYVFAIPHAQ